jgi:hypothetical protein
MAYPEPVVNWIYADKIEKPKQCAQEEPAEPNPDLDAPPADNAASTEP